MKEIDIDTKDWRPLFKRYMGFGYMSTKSLKLRIARQTLSNILAGKRINPEILDECLQELKQKMETRAAAVKRVNELTQIHRQLQGQ